MTSLLRRYAPLADDTEAQLAGICGPSRTHRSGSCIEPMGSPKHVLLVLAGWVAEERSLSDGRRQIVRLHLPGELVGHGGPHSQARSDIIALADTHVADVSGLRGLAAGPQAMNPIAAAWRGLVEAEEEAALRHLVRLGRMTAFERTSHVLLELYERQTLTGQVNGRAMPMLLTQEQMADYLGLSVVHVNRTLQLLRREKLIETEHRSMALVDIQRLASLCGYPLAPARTEGAKAMTA